MYKELNIERQKFSLSNGLEVILHRDSRLPLAAVNLWYKVGSANEVEGKTGFAHLFEHMMFQGSQNVPKEMHFKYLQEAGGHLNGSTGTDRTNYYESLPSSHLELALWLESDRMGYFIPALTQEKLANQIDVVKNERLQRYDNQPYGLMWELLFSNLYPKGHPYHYPTIGLMDDISNIKLDEVKNFFELYYAPNNASLVIAGDIDFTAAEVLVKKYFDGIPQGKLPPRPVAIKTEIQESKTVIHEDDVSLSRILFAWPSADSYSEGDAALDLFADVLTGSKNARLYKKLVHEKETAQDVSSFQHSGKYGGAFVIAATAKANASLDLIKEEIFNTLDEIIKDGIIGERERMRSLNGIKSSSIYAIQNLDNLANQLNNYNFYIGEPNSFIYDLKRYDSCSSEEIYNAFIKYLTKNYVELRIIPKQKRNND
ncbi:MAG TPA: pitrilysin family protein [Ignavibacteriales bacterium]|nr:pitrilysin family protein [Ignavibacteriales bacterium]